MDQKDIGALPKLARDIDFWLTQGGLTVQGIALMKTVSFALRGAHQLIVERNDERRDYFAGCELSKIQGANICDQKAVYERVAEHCFRMADAMIERSKQ
jgi:hypothetical protein